MAMRAASQQGNFTRWGVCYPVAAPLPAAFALLAQRRLSGYRMNSACWTIWDDAGLSWSCVEPVATLKVRCRRVEYDPLISTVGICTG